MQYIIEYGVRAAGLSHEQNLANQDALLKAFGNWTGEESLEVQAFVSKLNLTGGYILVESGDPTVVSSFVSKFLYWNDIEVVPVVEISEAVTTATASLAWTRSALND